MATGLAAAQANALIDALLRNQSYTPPAAVWVKLHLGDPGAAGTSNPATETTRKQATFSAASGGATTTTGALTWPSYPASETVSHISLWDASSGGSFIASDALNTPQAVNSGGTFEIATGDLDSSIGAVAA